MAITKCPHTHRKHYAKVSFKDSAVKLFYDKLQFKLIYIIFRICVQAVIVNMEEIKMRGIAHIMIDFCIQWGCAKLAISLIIIR